MAAVRIALLCATAALAAPIYDALPASLTGGRFVITQCLDAQHQVTTSLHAIPTCTSVTREFDHVSMAWGLERDLRPQCFVECPVGEPEWRSAERRAACPRLTFSQIDGLER